MVGELKDEYPAYMVKFVRALVLIKPLQQVILSNPPIPPSLLSFPPP